MTALLEIWGRIRNLIEKFSCLPPLLTRLVVGIMFMGTGWGKLHNIPKVTEFFTGLGIPAPGFHAYLVASTEFGCGALLVLGLLTRLASVPLMCTMIVAIITAKRAEINELNDLLGMSEFLLIILLFWLFVEGGGLLSLDKLLTGKMKSKV